MLAGFLRLCPKLIYPLFSNFRNEQQQKGKRKPSSSFEQNLNLGPLHLRRKYSLEQLTKNKFKALQSF